MSRIAADDSLESKCRRSEQHIREYSVLTGTEDESKVGKDKQHHFVAGAAHWCPDRFRTRAPRDPWTKQDLHHSGGWVGVRPSSTLTTPPLRSAVGGWLDRNQWLEAYQSHYAPRGRGHNYGSLLPPDAALAALTAALACPPSRDRLAVPTCDAQSQLRFDEHLYAARWGSGSGAWLPPSGSMTGHGAWPEHLRAPHKPRIVAELLPGIAKQPPPLTAEAEEIDRQFSDYRDAGYLVRWDAEWGLPTATSAFYAIQQSLGKWRIIIDYRYVNGSIAAVELSLPSVAALVRNVRQGDLLTKQDMKAGYHQLALDPSSYHLAALLWRGELWVFTCVSFGWRDAPGAFQAHTQHIASLLRTPSARMSRVYLDDFLQAWDPRQFVAEDLEAWYGVIAEHGVALGRKKCIEPSTRCEWLGIVVDSRAMTISVGPEKGLHVRQLIRETLDAQTTSTRRVAVLLGKLNAVDIAMRMTAVLSRSVVDALVAALRDTELDPELHDGELLLPTREAEVVTCYAWSDKPMTLSEAAREDLRTLEASWDSLNGMPIVRPQPTLIVRTDASDVAAGYTIWEHLGVGRFKQIAEGTIPLPQDHTTLSSTAREAKAMELAFATLSTDRLRKAVVECVVDNQSLAHRFRRSTGAEAVNSCLRAIVARLLEADAIWAGTWWSRRSFMTEEDALSKEFRWSSPMRVRSEWFATFLASRQVKPNVDAFATKEDTQLTRYVTLVPDRDALGFDGCRFPWSRTDVPWAFPPMDCILPAFDNWRRSSSRSAYFCLPALPRNHRLVEPIVTAPEWRNEVGRAQVDGSPPEWYFKVHFVRKT